MGLLDSAPPTVKVVDGGAPATDMLADAFDPPPPPWADGGRGGLDGSPPAADSAPPPAQNGVRCDVQGGATQLVRVKDGKALGSSMSASDCQGAVAAAHSGVVCAIVASGQGSAVWKAMNIELGIELGRYPIPRDDCFESTRHARNGVVCSHTGVNPSGKLGFKPTNITKAGDTGFMGSSAWLAYCKIATLNAKSDRVCANGNGGTGDHAFWYENYIATQNIVQGGKHGTVYACSGASAP
ncbi:MAG: hypothetical protein KC503_25840 [Myxococcales bacterium]|nr:hypothetical protein [Myxococcales bacterium]